MTQLERDRKLVHICLHEMVKANTLNEQYISIPLAIDGTPRKSYATKAINAHYKTSMTPEQFA